MSQSQFTSCCGAVVVRREYLIATFTTLVVTVTIKCLLHHATLRRWYGKRHLLWGVAKIVLRLVNVTIHNRSSLFLLECGPTIPAVRTRNTEL